MLYVKESNYCQDRVCSESSGKNNRVLLRVIIAIQIRLEYYLLIINVSQVSPQSTTFFFRMK